MTGIDFDHDGDDLARYIAKRAERDPGFPQLVESALQERREQRRAATQCPSSRDLTAISMHAVAREQRERYHRNGTQRKRGR